MGTIKSEIQLLAPSALIEMFELDLTKAGGDIQRFHAGTNKLSQSLIWQGNTYAPLPIEAEGFDVTTKGTLPRPHIRAANVQGLISAEIAQMDDLVGCKVTRKRTFARFLDRENFAVSQKGINASDSTKYSYVSGISLRDRFTYSCEFTVTTAATNYISSCGFLPGVGAAALLVTAAGALQVLTSNDPSDAALIQTADGVIVPGVKNHAAIRFDQGNIDLVLGGIVVGSIKWGGSIAGPINLYPSYFSPNGGSFIVSNAKLYSRVLKVDEIYIQAQGKASVDESGLLGFWTFNQTLNDASGNGRNAVATSPTYASMFDANPSADPTQYLPDDVWFIEQKISEDRYVVEWELASAFDLEGVQLPSRQIVQNGCSWKYRSWNSTTGTFNYTGTSECGYTGTSYFDKNNSPTTDPSKDFCSKRLPACIKRFPNGIVPFGGFPGASRFDQ